MRLATVLIVFSLTEYLNARQSPTAQNWIELGEKAYRTNNYLEAVQDLQRALALDPSNQRVLAVYT